MVRVKICGITNKEDALKVVDYGAWAIGFIFCKKSPRYISSTQVKHIVEVLPPLVTAVGVFVNEKENVVRDICELTHIRTVQFHGEETPAYCQKFKGYKIIKAFFINDSFDSTSILRYKVDAYLFDTYYQHCYGGGGKPFDWKMLRRQRIPGPLILSGGLNAGNIREAVDMVHPYAVDVSSGVEKSPGIKSPRLLKTFFAKVN